MRELVSPSLQPHLLPLYPLPLVQLPSLLAAPYPITAPPPSSASASTPYLKHLSLITTGFFPSGLCFSLRPFPTVLLKRASQIPLPLEYLTSLCFALHHSTCLHLCPLFILLLSLSLPPLPNTSPVRSRTGVCLFTTIPPHLKQCLVCSRCSSIC